MYLLRTATTAAVCRRVCGSAQRLHAQRGWVSRFSNATLARAAEFPEHEVLGLPALSPTMTEGTVQSWTVQVGDSFSAGDIICQIETDKAAVDFEATDDGFMAKHMVEAGHAPIPTGTIIAVTVMEEEDIAAFADAKPEDFASAAAVEEKAAPAPTVAATPAPAPTVAATPPPVTAAPPSPMSAPARPPAPSTGFSAFSEKRQLEYVNLYGSTLLESIDVVSE